MFNDTFLQTCRGEKTQNMPVWFMRQAGRSLPGYRKLRETYDVLTLTSTPELAAQVSLEPVTLHGVDAAILFADIMLLPIALGVDVKIVDAIGPIIDTPIVTKNDVQQLQSFSPERVAFLSQTIKLLREELTVPLIGFAGAPFTVASYLIEGKPSRTWQKTKHLMYTEPEVWHILMQKLTNATVLYLHTQVQAGAQALQLFDSWVGCLSPSDYRHYVLPYMQQLFSALYALRVPRIHFGTNTAGLLHDFANVECEVISLDWRVELSQARAIIGSKVTQGNLDPNILLADWQSVKCAIDHIFRELKGSNAHIFNLGHGVLPETSEDMIKQVVEYVHVHQ